MFLPNSRYANQPVATVTAADGTSVSVVTIRRIPPTPARILETSDLDRIDLLAHTVCADATKGWRIADANSALDAARELDGVATHSPNVPVSP